MEAQSRDSRDDIGGRRMLYESAKPPYYPPLKGFIENYWALEGDQNCQHTECGGEMTPQSICFINWEGAGISIPDESLFHYLLLNYTLSKCLKCTSNTIMLVIICRLCNPERQETGYEGKSESKRCGPDNRRQIGGR